MYAAMFFLLMLERISRKESWQRRRHGLKCGFHFTKKNDNSASKEQTVEGRRSVFLHDVGVKKCRPASRGRARLSGNNVNEKRVPRTVIRSECLKHGKTIRIHTPWLWFSMFSNSLT